MTKAEKIAAHLARGDASSVIAAAVGCSVSYVNTVKVRLRNRAKTGSGKYDRERASNAKRYAVRYQTDAAFHESELERFRREKR